MLVCAVTEKKILLSDRPGLKPYFVASLVCGPLNFIVYLFFFLFRTTPLAYGGSQARGPIGL